MRRHHDAHLIVFHAGNCPIFVVVAAAAASFVNSHNYCPCSYCCQLLFWLPLLLHHSCCSCWRWHSLPLLLMALQLLLLSQQPALLQLLLLLLLLQLLPGQHLVAQLLLLLFDQLLLLLRVAAAAASTTAAHAGGQRAEQHAQQGKEQPDAGQRGPDELELQCLEAFVAEADKGDNEADGDHAQSHIKDNVGVAARLEFAVGVGAETSIDTLKKHTKF